MTSRDMTRHDPLIAELLDALVRESGDLSCVASITRRPSEYRTSHVLEEIDIALENGEVLELVAKNVARGALTEVALQAKPAFLGNQMREIETYRRILNSTDMTSPQCYGASVDESSDHFWLFVERVAGVELYQIGELEIWQEVARWLASFHNRFDSEEAKATARIAAPLIEYDRDFFRTWRDRAMEYSSAWPADARHKFCWIAERYEAVIERLTSLPSTVIHGEFYASNILIERKSTGVRVAPVDWELAAIGPGLIDLAALTAGSWSNADRISFAAAYHRARTRNGSLDDLLTDLAFCRLHLAVQWLGWSPQWTPPREHAHDWLGEAVRLTEELRL